tara:strand:- start:61 stop:279 length:219 start_codon:yes stop_codon:yes gene_type:complete
LNKISIPFILFLGGWVSFLSGDGDGLLEVGEGLGEGEGVGVGDGLGEGQGVGHGVGQGEGQGEGEEKKFSLL